MRRAKRATSGSWVTSTTVMPWRLSSWNSAMISRLVVRVERAGRLVGEDQQRLGDQRARDRHALLLAAGELRGVVVGALAQPDALQHRQRARACAPAPATPA